MTSPRRKKIKLVKWRNRHPDKWSKQQMDAMSMLGPLMRRWLDDDKAMWEEACKFGADFTRYTKEKYPRWFAGCDAVVYATFDENGLVIHDD